MIIDNGKSNPCVRYTMIDYPERRDFVSRTADNFYKLTQFNVVEKNIENTEPYYRVKYLERCI